MSSFHFRTTSFGFLLGIYVTDRHKVVHVAVKCEANDKWCSRFFSATKVWRSCGVRAYSGLLSLNPPVCASASAPIQPFCEGLRHLFENMSERTKAHSWQLRENLVQTFKARLGYKTMLAFIMPALMAPGSNCVQDHYGIIFIRYLFSYVCH